MTELASTGSRTAYLAVGGPAAVVTSTPLATEAALDVLTAGGTATDALIAASAVQCVVENGNCSVAGMWISHSYNEATGQTETLNARIGPAQAEPYDFGAESPESYSGRGMPVPGWVAGAHEAWRRYGRLPWASLLEPAIAFAAEGFALDSAGYARVKAAPVATRTAEGRALWMRDGRYLRVGETVRQPDLAGTIERFAKDGPEAFYEGEFAEHYVAASQARGGRLTMQDLAGWSDRVTVTPAAVAGDYFGHQVATDGALTVYGLHLAEAADLGALSPEDAAWAHLRIVEELFAATESYDESSHAQFVDPAYAAGQLDRVLSAPHTPTDLSLFYNTATSVVRDADGNVAWHVHSVNSPTVGGAGFLVDGAYATRVISRRHGTTGYLLAPGLFSNLALYRDGRPTLVAGSPGIGLIHGPLAFTIGVVQHQLDPLAAVSAPRFGLATPLTGNRTPFEGHHPPSVFRMLEDRGVPFYESSPTTQTGLVGGMVIEQDVVHTVHDTRGEPGAAVLEVEAR